MKESLLLNVAKAGEHVRAVKGRCTLRAGVPCSLSSSILQPRIRAMTSSSSSPHVMDRARSHRLTKTIRVPSHLVGFLRSANSSYWSALLDPFLFTYPHKTCNSHRLTTSACISSWSIAPPPIWQIPARGRFCRFSRQPCLCDLDLPTTLTL